MDMLKQPDVDHDERMDQFSTAKSHDDDDADDPNGVVKDDNPSPTSTKLSGVGDTRADRLEEMQSVVKKVVYESRGPLYMDLCSRTSPHLGALVKSFRATADGGKGQAELSGNVHVGDLVLALNDVDCTILPFQRIVLEAKNANFPLVLQVFLNSTHVVVIQISEDDFNTVVDAPYDGHLHVYLDPEDPTRFILRFRPLGDAVGTCDTGLNPTIHQATLATLHLTAQSASTRDIIASTVRTFRANRLSADVDASARDVEANYFGEVVDKAKLTAPAVSLLVSDKTDGDCPSLSEDVRGVALVGDGKSPPVQTMTETAAAADDVAILKKQLASQALLLKATQNERNFMAVAVEVRERKLEDQAAAHKLLQATVDTLRGELQVAHAAIARTKQHGQSVGDLEAHLIERTQLQIDLAEAKADVKRYMDEMNEFKNALDCHVKQRGMGDVEMQRVLSQNKELQRLVTHFSTSLSASQDQVAKWKKLFDSSPLKHVMTTQRRLSKSTSFQRNEQLVFDEDDEEEEDEEEEEE
ncbi:hypothetical protein B5M09_007225 [Aphanomyces astaci]|uniref:PDZ domain-containing protein n=1 Tax=Aphanomyces astaci TaxID=112090 RepID=A0A425D2X6_APHAT|nr:hypothetical protein B5M09_007225 [Aphanomyces astaci]